MGFHIGAFKHFDASHTQRLNGFYLKPRTPRTNGMVERLNGRIADVLKTHRFTSGEDLEQTLMRYVALHNHQLPQSSLKSKTPMKAMKDWYASHPHLFVKTSL